MLQKLLNETKAAAKFLGLELRQLEVHQTRNGGVIGSCKVNGHHVWLPKVRPVDNVRKLVTQNLLNFVENFEECS